MLTQPPLAPARLVACCRRAARTVATALILVATPLVAGAKCSGINLLSQMPATETAALEAATAAQPYARGNLWRASKAGQSLHIIGTYHLADARHAPIMARLAPILAAAPVLLVEAGPEEERALKRDIAADPGLLFLTEGPSLKQQLSPEDWQMLSAAMARRNMPAMMAAKMRPWYLAVTLAIPPCGMPEMTTGSGLDHQLIAQAQAQDIPIRALEPHTTLFRLFDTIPQEDQLGLIRTTLLMEDRITDYSVTLADSYFAGESRLMWEYMRLESAKIPGYSPEKADAEYARLEAALMSSRNRAWIERLEQAAAEGPALAAVGALHLSGEAGVLQLLADRGWQIEALPL